MIRAIVTDIEGTTSAIRFVHDVLFPYARKRLAAFVVASQHCSEVAKVLDDLRTEIAQPQATVDVLITVLFSFMEEDRKSTALKTLQGMIWQDGYLNGDFTGHIYPDVLPSLRKWRSQGIDLYVYSSGSVAAQKLLFGYSDEGDITDVFSGYFDTHIGAKRQADAYRAIGDTIGFPPSTLLFLSDVPEELDAASDAGWHSVQLVRDDIIGPCRHRQVKRFDQINLEWFAL